MTAGTPEDAVRQYVAAMAVGDLDAALSSFTPDATFALPSGFGEGSATGVDALREVFTGFLAMNPELSLTPGSTLVSGDTALATGRWTLNARGPDGNPVIATGRYADVIRRQPDGRWLIAIDNSNA